MRAARLTTAFMDELAAKAPPPLSPPASPSSQILEKALADACARGRAAFPNLTLDDDAFVRHLARALPSPDAASLATLAADDMYLAAACLAKVPGAVDTFAQRHGPTIRAVVTRLLRHADARDVEQRLLDKLVVGTAEVGPRLATYVGRAPLDRWVGVAARREAITWLRENRAVAQAHADAAAEPATGVDTHPELAFLRERYREEFESALKEALTRVTERERIVLRMHLVNGLSVEKVGKMLGVSQSTVSRWLAAARATLLDDIKANLGNRLGVTSAQLASLARLVASQLDMGLSQVLQVR